MTRNHDRREDQCRAIIGEQRRHQRAEQHHVGKQLAPTAPPPARHMQRGPSEESRFVEQQTDDDQCNEGAGGVPDDLPHQRNIAQVHDAEDQCEHGAERRAPADAEAFGLPDDKGDGQQEDQ